MAGGSSGTEGYYQLLFESSPLPMWVYDLDSLRFLAVNEAAIRHYGWSREEFLELTIMQIRPPEEAAKVRAILPGLPRAQDARTWHHRKKDGTVIAVEVSSHDFVFDGRRARLVLANDVTERERVQ